MNTDAPDCGSYILPLRHTLCATVHSALKFRILQICRDLKSLRSRKTRKVYRKIAHGRLGYMYSIQQSFFYR